MGFIEDDETFVLLGELAGGVDSGGNFFWVVGVIGVNTFCDFLEATADAGEIVDYGCEMSGVVSCDFLRTSDSQRSVVAAFGAG